MNQWEMFLKHSPNLQPMDRHILLKLAQRNYSKTCLKQSLKKKDKTKVLKTNGSLMKVESIAECSLLEHSAILLTCIKR